jgi:hypothetical protein
LRPPHGNAGLSDYSTISITACFLGSAETARNIARTAPAVLFTGGLAHVCFGHFERRYGPLLPANFCNGYEIRFTSYRSCNNFNYFFYGTAPVVV